MIQIGIACGDNCEHYVNFLIDSIRKTVSGNNDIQFVLGINKLGIDVPTLLLKNKDFDIKIVYAFEEEEMNPTSECHGRTLDAILDKMDSEYGMFVDCDCAFLEKNWDDTLLGLLNDKIVIIGPEYDGQKYMGFPNIVGCLFKTLILRELQVSLVPKGIITIDESNSLIYGREIGDVIQLDVGWELCYKLKKNGYGGIPLPLVRTQNKDGVVKSENTPRFIGENMRGEEHQLNGIPILTHVGRSSTRDFLTDPIIIKWRSKVEEWIAND